MLFTLSSLLYAASLVSASPAAFFPRAVTSLNEAATEEAHKRDDTATRAFSNTQIKTSSGKCLFVDKLSGDFRANLTPIQVADCGATDGQGWDIITKGVHNNVANSALVVSTLTQACFNFDDRRAAGNKVLLFSCGGRADGGGQVTNSQLFTFTGGAGPLQFLPENSAGNCFVVKGTVLDIAPCSKTDQNQFFTFVSGGGAAAAPPPPAAVVTTKAAAAAAKTTTTAAAAAPPAAATSAAAAAVVVEDPPECPAAVTVTVTAADAEETQAAAAPPPPAEVTAAPAAGGIPNPTTAVPVSRAGLVLQPSAAAEANQKDTTATRAFTSVSIKAPNGQCLFVDPTAGDFRQNLIPISLVPCGGTDNEKFDVITAGKHNNAKNSALIVSSLTNGCMSFDGRRAVGDTVTIFSCGGRGDGSGQTNNGQLVPFVGGTKLVFAPESENNKTCIIPVNGKIASGPCTNDGTQVFTIVA